jgi:hypothetical protein
VTGSLARAEWLGSGRGDGGIQNGSERCWSIGKQAAARRSKDLLSRTIMSRRSRALSRPTEDDEGLQAEMRALSARRDLREVVRRV